MDSNVTKYFMSGKRRKKTFRFSAKKDIDLLKVVLDYRPWEYGPSHWLSVANNLRAESGYDVTGRTCRLRIEGLLEAYKKKDLVVNLRKNGTDEEYAQRDEFLEELVELMMADPETELNSQTQYPGDSKLVELKKIPLPSRSAGTETSENSQKLVKYIEDHPMNERVIADLLLETNEHRWGQIEVEHRDRSRTPSGSGNSSMDSSNLITTPHQATSLHQRRLHDRIAQESDRDESFVAEESPGTDHSGSSKMAIIETTAFLKENLEMEKHRNAAIHARELRELDLKERELALEEKKLDAQIADTKLKAELEFEKIRLENLRHEREHAQMQQMYTLTQTMMKMVQVIQNNKST